MDLRLPHKPVYLESRWVVLRSLKEVSLDYVDWLNDPKVNAFLEVRHTRQTQKSVVDYIDAIRKKFPGDVLGVYLRRSELHIGNIAIHVDPTSNEITYGCIIGHKKYKGMGFGYYAQDMVIRYLFESVGLSKVQTGVEPKNISSLNIIKKLGFQEVSSPKKECLLFEIKKEDFICV